MRSDFHYCCEYSTRVMRLPREVLTVSSPPAESSPPSDSNRGHPPEILLVDDDPGAIVVLSKILGDLGRLRFATSGAEALTLARQQRPDLVLLDIEMPEMSGISVCKELKRDGSWADVPVIFITSHNDQAYELAGLAAGAVDFIAKPPLPQLVRARVATHLRLKRLTDLLRQSASQDAVTGIANRRAFEEKFPKEWLRSLREDHSLSLFMIDVDYFKDYNDSHGHQAGDECLHRIAQALLDGIEAPGALLARYGGDEFVLVAPRVSVEQAWRIADDVRREVADLRLQHAASPMSGVVTASVGGATFVPDTWRGAFARSAADESLVGPASLLFAADQALYAAKERGRDTTVVELLLPTALVDRTPPSSDSAGVTADD